MNIYVSNLSYDTTTESLQELFAEYGEISSVNIIRDRISGQSRGGFGFVEMPNDDNAQKAIDELNNSDLKENNHRKQSPSKTGKKRRWLQQKTVLIVDSLNYFPAAF